MCELTPIFELQLPPAVRKSKESWSDNTFRPHVGSQQLNDSKPYSHTLHVNGMAKHQLPHSHVSNLVIIVAVVVVKHVTAPREQRSVWF
jgi:hypothetical protein